MLQTIINVILFLVFLSVLITFHEFGHFIAAKCFKVYCTEFSIGFGPALLHKKKKGAETFFSLRAIPFGGYVAMYDEKANEANPIKDENGQPIIVPKERSFNGIQKWKRVIVLLAGVTMNAILALILFFISASCFAQKNLYVNVIEGIDPSSPCGTAGLVVGDVLDITSDSSGYYVFGDGLAHYSDTTEDQNITLLLNPNLISGYSDRNIDNYIGYYFYSESTDNGETVRTTDYENPVSPYLANLDYLNITLNKRTYNDDGSFKANVPVEITIHIELDGEYKHFEKTGIVYTLYQHWNSFGESVKETFVDFGESATLIIRSLGSLFTSTESWGQMGGIVAIGVTSSNVLSNLGWSYFLYLWGMISVNLAIINLIPFPGLDGWQILVIIIEAIRRKPVPDKVKSIVQFVGMAILFALMIILVFKDLFTFFF